MICPYQCAYFGEFAHFGCGQFVEQANSSTLDVVVYGTSSSKLRGIALDPGVSGNLMRVILIAAQGYGS